MTDRQMLVNSSDQTRPDEPGTPSTWSPESETALLLDLCEAQMEAAMRDSDEAVDVLVSSFTDLVNATLALNDLTQKSTPGNATATNELQIRTRDVGRQINEAIVAFQFYDKLTQRLGHVRHSLTTLALFVCDRKHTMEREHWKKLLTSLRRLYRTQEERAVFDMVAEGATADEVRAAVANDMNHAAASSVELF
jgi:hypothetical protein